MKNILILLLLTHTCPAMMLAQDEPARQMMESDEFVEKEIEAVEWLTEKIFTLGEMKQNQPATVEYKFRNLSENPLVITQVKSSCSCSVSEYTKTPIEKGGIGIIKATYDAKAEGEFFKTFLLLTSRSTTPNVLVISGHVIAE